MKKEPTTDIVELVKAMVQEALAREEARKLQEELELSGQKEKNLLDINEKHG